MYFQPYGDDQQLNLNWIINEIINLHKQLDPDYETPSFTQVYPYSNLNRLNLDWILSELKALKELAPEPAPAIDIQAVAEALVALPFDSNTSYQIYDFISRDGEIWRATEAIPAGGEWDSSKWFKTKIGTDLAVLERWINTINNSLTSEIQARQDADTALQTNIDNEALARQQADTALQNTINGLTSANISDDSDAGGANVKASLNALKGSLNTVEDEVSDLDGAISAIDIMIAPVETGTTASRQYNANRYLILNNKLYRTLQIINAGATFTVGTNIIEDNITNAIGNMTVVHASYNALYCNDGNVYAYKLGRLLFLSGWIRISTAPTGANDIVATGLPLSGFKQYVLGYDESAKDIVCLLYDNNDTNIKAGYGDYSKRIGHIIDFTGAYLITNN